MWLDCVERPSMLLLLPCTRVVQSGDMFVLVAEKNAAGSSLHCCCAVSALLLCGVFITSNQ